jgi:hypothetical protein
VRLVSDYNDYYDHHMDGRWGDKPLLNRRTRVDRSRDQDRALLGRPHYSDGCFYDVPSGQSLADLRETVAIGERFTFADRWCVVYVDPLAHRGEGKIATTWDKAAALPLLGTCLTTEFVGQPYGETPRESVRLLMIGNRPFFMTYRSCDPWRSNCGDVQIEMAHELVGRSISTRPARNIQRVLKHPLLAIDFVYHDGHFLAVDLNTAPGLRGTPVQDMLRPEEVVGLLDAWCAEST